MIYFILVIGLFLRLINLNQSLWLDEAIQAWATSGFTLNKLITQFMPTDVHPPLSYLVSLFTGNLIGFSEISLRLPSVIFGVITIYVVYKISKLIKLENQNLPTLLLATSGLHIYYSQEARMYSLATLLVSLSIYYLIKSLKNNKFFIYYLIFTLLALYSHYYTWFMLPVHLIIVLLTHPKKLKTLLLAQTAVIIGFLPLAKTFIHQLGGGLNAATSNPGWASVVGGLHLKSMALIPVKFLIGRITFDNKLIYAFIVAVPLLISTSLFYLLIKNTRPKADRPLDEKNSSTIILTWLFIPLIIAILVSIKIPILGFHRFLFVLPALYLGLSKGLSCLKPSLQKILTIILLLVNLTTSGIYLLNPIHHREDWRGLVQELSSSNHTQAPVAILAPVRTPLIYYYAGKIINYQDITPDFKTRELWLVPYAESIFEPFLETKKIINTLGFKEVYQRNFRGNLILIQYTNEDWN
ncbi:glycosyltransferase family 39 protein [Patescibacteria group bacterium]|nr:glycosyltransferase family 39 protein [Patescibacteria group bacterium]